jgi:glutathione S-transferase
MQLIIGNKNYSSWSLRAWLLLRQLDIAFDEEVLDIGGFDFKTRIRKISGAGRVPVLIDGQSVVWDSLAIAEYLAEKYPQSGVWPSDAGARAHARSCVSEMHSGFVQIRSRLPMNVRASLPGMGWDVSVQGEIDRVENIWAEARERFAGPGPFLYGTFCAADAFFAPIVLRFLTYGVRASQASKQYMQTMRELPTMQEWATASAQESWVLDSEELYQTNPESASD